MKDASTWIQHLNLLPHPEGGWFKEVYRSSEYIPQSALPERFNGSRSFCTSIYFLLRDDEFSAFHRIKQDELWHFYAGDALSVHVINTAGQYAEKKLGSHIEQGESFQHVVEAGDYFAASLPAGGFALVGCTVAPGFDFADFEMPSRDDLINIFPAQKSIIHTLTR